MSHPRRLVPYGRRHSRPPHPLRQWLSSGSHFPPGIVGNANASATRYGLMPASWITFAHFGMSALIRALNSSGLTAEGSYPIASIFSLRSGEATARAISRYKRSTISRGVPAGAQTHCGASCTWPGTPASSIVGTSGRIATRFVLVTASARSRPSLICADADGSVANATGVWPPTTDCTIGPPPPNGTVTMSSLSDSLNSSVDRCGGVPAPAMANSAHQRDELLHGFGGHRRMHDQHLGRRRSDDDRLEIPYWVIGNLRIEAGVDPQRGTSDQ